MIAVWYHIALPTARQKNGYAILLPLPTHALENTPEVDKTPDFDGCPFFSNFSFLIIK
jgi:hypothetical protein